MRCVGRIPGRQLPALRRRPDRVADARRCAARASANARACARTRATRAGAIEVFVHSPDRDGLFATIVATLDRSGLGDRAGARAGRATAWCSTRSEVPCRLDAATPRRDRRGRAAPARAALAGRPGRSRPRAARMPRQLRHFRMPPQRRASRRSDAAARTQLSLVCTDRPGLLARRRASLARAAACACTTRASRPSASAPRTSSSSPTSRPARSTTRSAGAARGAARLPRRTPLAREDDRPHDRRKKAAPKDPGVEELQVRWSRARSSAAPS